MAASILAGMTILMIGDSHLATPDYLIATLHNDLVAQGAFLMNEIRISGHGALTSIFSKGSLDASDGLAVAVCHHFNSGNLVSDKNYSGWDSFLKQNPDRLK